MMAHIKPMILQLDSDMMRRPLHTTLLLLSLVLHGTALATVDFQSQILPILSDNCLECHGPDASHRKAGLRLDTPNSSLAPLKSGLTAIVPGKPESSELVTRILTSDPDDIMPPPSFPRTLTPLQKDLLQQWIREGAPYSEHWAYNPLRDDPPPQVQNFTWPHQPMDHFVLQALESREIAPSPRASRSSLIKRLSYDLLGTLPSPDDVDRFLNDTRPNAYALLVDRLLESPQFGERWGRHWLDKARYADSDGYEKDNPRPNAWRYRDWVIQSINRDQPFDEFTVEQLAGDLLPNPTDQQHLATAFHRQTLTNTEGGTDPEQWRVAAVMDRSETTSALWLGLTLGCARCHDHKYDAISHQEYYQFYAFFNNADETTQPIPSSPEAVETYQTQLAQHTQELNKLENELNLLRQKIKTEHPEWEQSYLSQLTENPQSPNPEEGKKNALILEALQTPPDKRDADRVSLVQAQLDSHFPELKALRQTLESHRKNVPTSPYLKVRTLAQRTENPRLTHIFEKGEFTQPTTPVTPNTLQSLPPLVPRNPSSLPDRLDLARWLISGQNPLPPRVIVNHFWIHLFGKGLVDPPNDFGVRGTAPSHPELLDHLAQKFIQLKWSRKAMIRYIVLSSTYQQSSHHRPELADLDPNNRWLYRQNRFRVEAETLRDLSLDAGKLLSYKIGGPSVFPPTSPDIVALTYNSSVRWTVSPGEDQFRRGLYTFFKRTAPHPNLITFDGPDSNTTCVERRRSNTPLGALTSLNNDVFQQATVSLGLRIALLPAATDEDRLQQAFQLTLLRSPSTQETKLLLDLYHSALQTYQNDPEAANNLLSSLATSSTTATDQSISVAAWCQIARSLLNLDEFLTRE